MIPPTSAQQTIADGVYVGATLISEGLAGGEQARPGGGGPGGGQPGLKSLRYSVAVIAPHYRGAF